MLAGLETLKGLVTQVGPRETALALDQTPEYSQMINQKATVGTCGIVRRTPWQSLSTGGGEGGSLQKRITGTVGCMAE